MGCMSWIKNGNSQTTIGSGSIALDTVYLLVVQQNDDGMTLTLQDQSTGQTTTATRGKMVTAGDSTPIQFGWAPRRNKDNTFVGTMYNVGVWEEVVTTEYVVQAFAQSSAMAYSLKGGAPAGFSVTTVHVDVSTTELTNETIRVIDNGMSQSYDSIEDAISNVTDEHIGVWQRSSGEYYLLKPGNTYDWGAGVPNHTVHRVWSLVRGIDTGRLDYDGSTELTTGNTVVTVVATDATSQLSAEHTLTVTVSRRSRAPRCCPSGEQPGLVLRPGQPSDRARHDGDVGRDGGWRGPDHRQQHPGIRHLPYTGL